MYLCTQKKKTMCPHTTSSSRDNSAQLLRSPPATTVYTYMCTHTTICVLILLYVSSGAASSCCSAAQPRRQKQKPQLHRRHVARERKHPQPRVQHVRWQVADCYFFFFELCTLEPGYLPSRMTSRVPVLRFVTAVGEPCPAHSTVITLLLDRLPDSWQPPE